MANLSAEQHDFTEIQKNLSQPKTDKKLFEAIVNAPFLNKLHATSIDLGIVVLLIHNKKGKTIDRVALSKTEQADWAVRMSPVPFHDIKIPDDTKQNVIAKAIRTGKPQKTSDWKYLFIPALVPEAARFNQAGAGIACSYVYPFKGSKKEGAMIFSYYQPLSHIRRKHLDFMEQYSAILSQVL